MPKSPLLPLRYLNCKKKKSGLFSNPQHRNYQWEALSNAKALKAEEIAPLLKDTLTDKVNVLRLALINTSARNHRIFLAQINCNNLTSAHFNCFYKKFGPN